MLGGFSCGVRRRKHRTGTPGYGAEPGNTGSANCCAAYEYAGASHKHASATYEHAGASHKHSSTTYEHTGAAYQHSCTTYEHAGASDKHAGPDGHARASDKHPCPDEHSDSADTDSRANGDAGADANASSADCHANEHSDTAMYCDCTGRGPAKVPL